MLRLTKSYSNKQLIRDRDSDHVYFTHSTGNIFSLNSSSSIPSTNRSSYKTIKCEECTRPFKQLANEPWKKLCNYCYAKSKGEIVQCSGCTKKIPVFPSRVVLDNYCYECYQERKGQPKVCTKCFKTFFYIPKSGQEDPMDCHDCYLKINGIKRKCLDCEANFYIMKGSKDWKKRCYECWLEPGRKKKKIYSLRRSTRLINKLSKK
jgi:hypothetical protein